jgi:N-acetylglucosaminyldiphosphoundecaprenol N-acetyl-beta-D-mannosaminyltransferase
MKKIKILGVEIDNVTESEALKTIAKWLKEDQKRYIVTPNIEFLMLAQKDKDFQEILNNADLAIPDSSRLGWAYLLLNTKNPIKRALYWPFFLFPSGVNLFTADNSRIHTLPGTDLMSAICSDWPIAIGLLGGKKGVAERLKECLVAINPKLKVAFIDSSAVIDQEGQEISKDNSPHNSVIPKLDILFVALGQGKQEKWIHKNLGKSEVKIMMGVGGAFDYLSGAVPRAPKWMRGLGLEWLYRLYKQPWRIKRFGNLVKFVFLILFERSEK